MVFLCSFLPIYIYIYILYIYYSSIYIYIYIYIYICIYTNLCIYMYMCVLEIYTICQCYNRKSWQYQLQRKYKSRKVELIFSGDHIVFFCWLQYSTLSVIRSLHLFQLIALASQKFGPLFGPLFLRCLFLIKRRSPVKI